MSRIGDANQLWAIVAIVLVPAAVIIAADVDERLRQRQSPFRRAVSILRSWALPLFAFWVILVPVLGQESESALVRLVNSGLLLALAAAALNVVRVLVGRLRNRPEQDDRQPIPQIVLVLPRVLVVITVAWILVDSVWGVDLSSALTALGVSSLVVSFALQDTLSGLASGLLLLSDQPFQPGDWIRTGEIEGQVIDINWRTSRIRDRNGDVTVVPNGRLASAEIVNFTSPDRLHRVVVPVQVAFVNAPTNAVEMLLDAARATDGVLIDPAPFVAVTGVDDPLMSYEVHLWIDDYAIAPRVSSDFGRLVWYQSHRHGVPLPSPAQDLYLYDGPTAAASTVASPDELRAAMLSAPVLASLPEDDLTALARTARSVRFSIGERLVASSDARAELMLLTTGLAAVHVEVDGHGTQRVSEIPPGDLIALVGAGGGPTIEVRAVTDCDVIILDGDTATDVASRNAGLGAAVNRVAALRRRRVERLVERLS